MKRPSGFSLIELLLAIGLSIALVTLLGMVISLHLVRLDSSQSSIEHAQVARAVLERITSDLKRVTTAPTQDVSELMEAAEAAAQFNVDELDREQSDEEEETTAPGDQTTTEPGLYGGPFELTLAAPRLEQRIAEPAPGAAPIARPDAAWSMVRYYLSPNASSPGLVRQEEGWDAALWRQKQGQDVAPARVLAPEVRRLAFRYHDGSQAVEDWDFAERGGLPLAVEVMVELGFGESEDQPGQPAELRVYRRWVALPAARDEASGDATMEQDASGAEL